MAANDPITYGPYSLTATLGTNRGAYWAVRYRSVVKNFNHPLAPHKAEIVQWLAGQSVRSDACEQLAVKLIARSRQAAAL